jgi:LmbE family N-acetylglucosaminyl deacetylase
MKRIHFLGFGILGLLLSVFLSFSAVAQKQHQMSSGEILHSIKKLKILGSVLYVAAHPDDENTRLIAHMAKERQYHTGYLAITRGDGGQNLIGIEQGVELGMIRTQELLAARRIDGGQQFFTRAYDFGYSKRTDEALAIWDKEKVLADAVWVIRNFKPDVIITRFPEDSRAGHGHHSGSAVIAREAFVAAADPKRFPEQFKYGVGPWQAKRILWNTFSFGTTNTTAENQMKIEVGQYIPLLGKSIGEIAAESRSQHRSQGFGSASSRGSSTEYFIHILGEKAEKDPMDGIDLSWNRVKGGDAISAQVDALVASFDPQHPVNAIPKLIAIKKELNNIGDDYWKKIKNKEVDQLIAMCSGLHIEALSNKKQIKQGDTLQVSLTINNRSGADVKIQEAGLRGIVAQEQVQLKKNNNWAQFFSLPISSSESITQPYWLVNEMNTGFFNVSNQTLIGDAENKPTFQVHVKLTVQGENIEVHQPVQYRFVNPAIGEFFHPVYVVPGKEDKNRKMHEIEYEHIPSLLYFADTKNIVLPAGLKTTGKKIGYLVGAGDKVPSALEMMGFEVVELGKNDIYAEKLRQFDAIVVGVRAYNVNEWLNEKHAILMDYVNEGGNMVVQYNTNSFAGPLAKMKIGPKPFTISRGRITEENAEVKFINPTSPLLNFPNKITANDFDGWIQERGIYFAENFSNDYQSVLSMHDQGEEDLLGSLIVRNEGKGRFIYTGLAFFRELPAGVGGAYRLFANLVSNPNRKLNDSK